MSIKVRVQDQYNLSVKSSSGSVRRIETGNGLTGGPITSTGTISINPGSGLIANSSGLFIDTSNIFPDTNVTANIYGSSTQIPVLNISSKGIINDVTLANVASIANFTYDSNNNTLTISTSDNTLINTTINSVNTFSVTGNLTTTGIQTYIKSNKVLFDDNILVLNKNLNNLSPDIGIAGYYQGIENLGWGSESLSWGTDDLAWDVANVYTGIIRDASDGRWKVFENYSSDPDANTELSTLTLADFQARTLYANSISANGSLGSAGQVLHSDGTNIYWSTDDVNGPAGNDTEIQFNNSGVFGANSGLTFNSVLGRLNIGNVGITSETISFGANGLSFSNGTSNAIFVSANGNVGIGNITPTSKLHVIGTANITESLIVQGTNVIAAIAASNAFTSATIAGANTAVGTGANAYAAAISNTISIAAFNQANAAFDKANNALANSTGTFSGNLTIDGTVTAVHFDNVSDITLKENVISLSNNDLLYKLNPVSFNWKNSGEKSFGLIAQEVEKIIPEIVHQKDDGTKTISYIQLISHLIFTVKDLQRQIDDINNNINNA